MRSKKIVVFMIGIFIIFSLSSYAENAETKKLKRIGVYTLVRIKGEIPAPEVMKTIIDKYTGDIKYGFDLAGYGDLYLPFIEQIKAASFEDKLLPVGDKLMWMLFRYRGKVKGVEDVEWAGKTPLPVYSFIVKKNYHHYEFVMPKPCGNVALRKVEEVIPDAICDIKVDPAKANLNDPITVDMSGSKDSKSMKVEVFDKEGAKVASGKLTPDSPKWQTKFDKAGEYVFKGKAFNVKGKPSENPCKGKTYINFPPVSKLESSVPEDYVGLPITLDASGATDPDGEVVKVDFEITDEGGNLVDRFADTEKPFVWEKTFEDEGAYAVTAVATDDFGAVSEPVRVEVGEKFKKLFFLIDGGPLAAFGGSTAGFFGARLGVLYKITPGKLDLIVEGGGAYADDPWKTFFMANALINYYVDEAFYIGGGAGFSTEIKDGEGEKVEGVVNAGYDVINKVKMKGSIFLEGRISGNSKIMLGFRILL